MNKKTYASAKGRNEKGSYFTTPHVVINTRMYRSFTYKAKSLMLDLSSQYKGNNNGDLYATWSMMKAAILEFNYASI